MSASLSSLRLPTLSQLSEEEKECREWALSAQEFQTFLKDINKNGGTENCSCCSLALDEILGQGIPSGIKPVPKGKRNLYTHPQYRGNTIISSFTQDKRLLARFAACAAPEAHNYRDEKTG